MLIQSRGLRTYVRSPCERERALRRAVCHTSHCWARLPEASPPLTRQAFPLHPHPIHALGERPPSRRRRSRQCLQGAALHLAALPRPPGLSSRQPASSSCACGGQYTGLSPGRPEREEEGCKGCKGCSQSPSYPVVYIGSQGTVHMSPRAASPGAGGGGGARGGQCTMPAWVRRQDVPTWSVASGTLMAGCGS